MLLSARICPILISINRHDAKVVLPKEASRMLPIGERASAWLDRFLAESRPHFDYLPNETALFLTGYGERYSPAYLGNWIKKLLRRCGIDRLGSCHLWRHSCATDMHRGGADIRYVQEMLGHERMETTQIYTHVHIEALREVHSRCHPHGRLDSNHDIYGLINAPEITDENLPSGGLEDLLSNPTNMVIAAPSLEKSFSLNAAPCHERLGIPPEDDPPIGGSSATSPKPPTNGGPPSQNDFKSGEVDLTKFSKSQDLRAGVTYYGYRYLDPNKGRWPSRDPIEEKGGKNLYGFVKNDGVDRFDKIGLITYYCDALWGWSLKMEGWKDPHEYLASGNGTAPNIQLAAEAAKAAAKNEAVGNVRLAMQIYQEMWLHEPNLNPKPLEAATTNLISLSCYCDKMDNGNYKPVKDVEAEIRKEVQSVIDEYLKNLPPPKE